MELERIELSSNGGGDSPKTNALQSWFVVDRAVVAFLIDSLPEVGTDDLTMYLHRKLSPFKIGILLERVVGGKEQEDSLIDLGQLMGYELKESGLDVFHGYDRTKSLEDNLSYSDRVGIPYNLILNRESLESGLIKLRSRNTTLSDKIHISDIPDYIKMIINN